LVEPEGCNQRENKNTEQEHRTRTQNKNIKQEHKTRRTEQEEQRTIHESQEHDPLVIRLAEES